MNTSCGTTVKTVPLSRYERVLRWRKRYPARWKAMQAKCQRRATKRLSSSYVRALLRQMGIANADITPELIRLETIRLLAIRASGTYQKGPRQ